MEFPMPSLAQSLQQAVQSHQAGQLGEAERAYRSIIRIDPKQPDALHLLGVIQQQRGNAQVAADYIGRAVNENPQAAVYHGNLAAAYQAMGLLEAALKSLEAAIQLEPGFANAHYNLGTVLRDLNRPAEAATSLQRAIQLDPNHVEALNNLGTIHAANDDWENAIVQYRQALQINPQNPDAWSNLGLAMLAINEKEEAKQCFERAISCSPTFTPAFIHLGNWHRDSGESAAAENCFRQALALEPDNTQAMNNLGLTLKEQGQYDSALQCFAQVLEDDSTHLEARVNRSYVQRLLGVFPAGWRDFDLRFQAEPLGKNFSAPVWQGESLAGKTILIHAELGVGDQVQYMSCLPEIASQADECILECDPRLVPLLARSYPQIKVFAEPINTESNPHDLQIPIASIAQFVRPTLDSFPQRKSFLAADPQCLTNWRNRFRELPGQYTVGISWRGGADAERQRNRTISIMDWKPLFAIPGIDFVNLQYGDHATELRELEQNIGVTIHDWDDSDPLKDLDNFAAEVAALDLVISIDNTTVHFAGGLGVPCWAMIPFDPDWRWMLNRNDNPWYPSIRLFRQPEPGDYRSPMEHITRELAEKITFPN